MKVIEKAMLKNQNANMAEKCFNAYKTVFCGCSTYEADVFGALYYNAEALLLSAKQGELWAVFEIGFMFESGIYFQKDLKEAFSWYEKGAKCGDDSCQLALFYMYRFGNGVTANLYKAIFWLKQSAENRNPSAMFILGQAYLDGVVEAVNYASAKYWLTESAVSGNVEAMLYMGHISEKGIGAAVDLENAYKWYLKAASLGDINAHICLAELVFDEFAGDEKRVKKAVYYLRKSIKMGNNNALYLLGVYYKGLGGKYVKKAFELLKKSADICGNILSALEVAEMYETGLGVEADADKAADYYSKVLNWI